MFLIPSLNIGLFQIALASGSTSLAKEQKQLVQSEGEGMPSRVDVLITTPGRLLEHLESTQGFDVSHVKYLVIDEADRLLGADFNYWMPPLCRALDSNKVRLIVLFSILL